MSTVDDGWDNKRPSTNWTWKKVKLSGSPPGKGQHSEGVPHRRDAAKLREGSFTLVVTYRGGPESSWLVRRNGRTWRIPGWLCFEDAMRRFEDGKPRSR